MNPSPDELSFYASPGIMTGPGEFASLLDPLPDDLPSLAKIIQGLLLHPFETELYSVDLTSVQRKELQIRTVREMLERLQRLDDRPLYEPRPPSERLVGNCRDHAVLYCALLRHKGIPARVRAGFATYLGDRALNYDHWVVEVWQAANANGASPAAGGRWTMVDSQIDDLQRQKHHIDFDTFNLTPAHFYTGGQAWAACQAGEAKSGAFGFNRKLRGWSFMRGTLHQDLAALNKVEVLPWDIWWDLARKGDDSLTPAERALLDQIAAWLVDPSAHFTELRDLFDSDARFGGMTTSRLKMLGLLPMTSEAGEGGGTAGNLPGKLAFQPSGLERLAALAGQRPWEEDEVEAPGAAPRRTSGWGSLDLASAIDQDAIVVRGAQQHNLKHVDITIPRHKLVVLTGVSGSGKSSLAFDTLYAEGQRRYVESLSAYVRRYLDQMDKPKVDYIGGLSPAIAIEQKSISKNPRSTVGTVTEVVDYLRVLYSRAGDQHCPQCGRTVAPVSAQPVAAGLAALPAGTRFQLIAPLTRARKGDHAAILEGARRDGYTRARLDGQVLDLLSPASWPRLRKSDPHTIELVVDRLVVPGVDDDPQDQHEFKVRLVDSVETALKAGQGVLLVDLGGGEEVWLSEHNTCPYCQISLPALSATLFSFNAPAGMCPSCNGLGTRLEVDPALIVEHPELSLMDGASRWYGNLRKKKGSHWLGNVTTIAEHYGADLNLPWKDLPQSFRDVLLFGSGDEKLTFYYENEAGSWRGENTTTVKGIVYHVNRLFRQTQSDYTRRWYMSFMSQQPCPACGGTRLCAEARYVTVGGKTFPEVTGMTIERCLDWVDGLLEGRLGLSPEQIEIVGEVLKELRSRLQFMINVGLHYLTLDRAAPTLSGGEGQRIRLASQLGCGLVGVLYILDEPSIGLHSRDQHALLQTLLELRDMGNTVLVVEHDEDTMRSADWLIDLGPGAGVMGGEVVSAGTPEQVAADPLSLTGRYLSGQLQVVAPNGGGRRSPEGWITVHGARLFNLKNVTAAFPLGVMTCVTGVSGSGKSSLVAETLFPALERALHNAQVNPGPHDRLEGLDLVDKVINITQDPIGRTPRSNPATYAGVFDDIRKVFASTPEARARGYKSDRFSFNVKGGRCEACQGHGKKRIEMHFLPDVWVTCQECKGARYNHHTLEITYKGKNIAGVLDMDVQEALEFFANHTHIHRILQTLYDVGLEYVKLGQSATTLSGGEAQRVKLAKELSRASTGRTVYILDEPTTGLHFADIQRLLDVLHRLTAAGNTVIVIEHNLDVVKTADWIIDMGPEGGDAGGYVIAAGTPEAVTQVEDSYTGQHLRRMLSPSLLKQERRQP